MKIGYVLRCLRLAFSLLLGSSISSTVSQAQQHKPDTANTTKDWQRSVVQLPKLKDGDVSLPHLKALVERFGELDPKIRGGFYPKIRPLVSIEQFFTGSNGQASLWVNSLPRKGIDEVQFWKSLRSRADVWDVLISLRQYDFPDTYQHDPFSWGDWVVSDVVVVITSATPEEILALFDDGIKPEYAGKNWPTAGERHERVFVPSGMNALFFWYD